MICKHNFPLVPSEVYDCGKVLALWVVCVLSWPVSVVP